MPFTYSFVPYEHTSRRNEMIDYIRICHGCGKEVYTYNHHWRVRVFRTDKPVFFHNDCYKHYPVHRIVWAQEKGR